MSVMSDLDSDATMKLLLLRLDAIESVLVNDLKVPAARIDELFMERLDGYVTEGCAEDCTCERDGEDTVQGVEEATE